MTCQGSRHFDYLCSVFLEQQTRSELWAGNRPRAASSCTCETKLSIRCGHTRGLPHGEIAWVRIALGFDRSLSYLRSYSDKLRKEKLEPRFVGNTTVLLNGGTQFSVNYYFFLSNSQLTTNFGWLLIFTFLQRILFRHNPNFPSLSKSITFGGRP